jgi:NitT/TauT family transport system permease protein
MRADAARHLRYGAPALVAVVALGLWEAAVALNDVPPWLVPAPSRIAATLVLDRTLLLDSLGVTLGIALAALAFAVVLGAATALLFVQSRWLEISLFPYAVLLQVTPIVAIFPIISNTTLGLRSVDPGLLALFRMNRASRWQELARLRIPSALPYFFGGLRIASGLALIGAVVAEFVAGTGGAGAGLASQILLAGIQLNVPRLFAALVLIAAAGVVLFGASVLAARLALGRWHESELRAPE